MNRKTRGRQHQWSNLKFWNFAEGMRKTKRNLGQFGVPGSFRIQVNNNTPMLTCAE